MFPALGAPRRTEHSLHLGGFSARRLESDASSRGWGWRFEDALPASAAARRPLAVRLGCLGGLCARPELSPGESAAGRQGEVGVALSRTGPRPYVAEGARPTAQGWWSAKWGERWLSTVLLGFDQSAVVGGWALRRDILQTRFTSSAEVELGFAWAAFSLPLSLAVTERAAVYCSPRVGNGAPSGRVRAVRGQRRAVGRLCRARRGTAQLGRLCVLQSPVEPGLALAQHW
jgi:hypothetical protein